MFETYAGAIMAWPDLSKDGSSFDTAPRSTFL